MKRLVTLVAAAIAAVLLASGAFAQAPAHLCDSLAANPYDPLRVAKGVDSQAIDAQRATAACIEAVRMYPDELRFQFQLGRAYRGAAMYAEAVYWYRNAADGGYAGAQNSLGVMYARGLGVEKNCAKAVEWYSRAADQGYRIASLNLERTSCIQRAALPVPVPPRG